MGVSTSYANILNNEFNIFKDDYKRLFSSGEVLKEKGQYMKAIQVYKECLDLVKKSSVPEKKIMCYMRLGLMYWNIGKLARSVELYKKAMFFSQAVGFISQERECQSYIDIYEYYSEGKKYRSSGQYQKSILSFKKAIDLSRQIQSKEHEAKCLRQLSICYLRLNNLKNFYSLNKKVLKLARGLNHQTEEGRCLNNIGIYHLKLAEYSKALSSYLNSLDISRKTNNFNVEADCLSNIALLYKHIGDYKRAIDYLEMAMEIDRQIGDDREISMDLNNLGIVYAQKAILYGSKNDYFVAMEYFKECLKLAEKVGEKRVEVRVLNNIAIIQRELNNYEESISYLQLALENSNKIRDIEANGAICSNLGINFFKKGLYKKASLYLQKAVEQGKRIKAAHILWEAYYGLGKCYEHKNELLEAMDCYYKSINEIDNIRSRIPLDTYKAWFVRDKLQIYESLIHLLYRLRDRLSSDEMGEKIFNVIEKAKARAFLEVLGESQINVEDKLNSELKNRQKDISNRIASLVKSLCDASLSFENRKKILEEYQQAENEYMLLLARMRAENPETANMVLPEPCHLKQLQEDLLDNKTALIEYFLGEKKSFVFIIKKKSFNLYLLPSKKEIRKSIRGFIKEISDPPIGRFRGHLAAKRLYQELLIPQKGELTESIENLIIVPDGLLYYLPFETLMTKSRERLSNDNFLIEKYKITYAPSCSSLLFLSRKKKITNPQKSLLAIGNPVFDLNDINKDGKRTPSIILKELYENQGFDFSSLPHSEKEIKEIARLFSPSKSDVFVGDTVREGLLKELPLWDYQIVHFACHGLIDEKFPFRSALVLNLNEDLEEDGFLLVREIYSLRLLADMVVLSACQTGRGKIENMEGVLGLPRIFFYCGAKSVVSSLWNINDRSTAKFMAYFYKFLSKGEDKAEALRMAKLKMLKSKYSHPYYWAAFVLHGDHSRIPISDW
jgi:CHAT domain-containing protein/TPR repeat protein